MDSTELADKKHTHFCQEEADLSETRNHSPRAEGPLEACPSREQYGQVNGASQRTGDWKSPRER